MAALLLSSPCSSAFLPPLLSSRRSPIKSLSSADGLSPCCYSSSYSFCARASRYRVSGRVEAVGEGSGRALGDGEEQSTVYQGVYGPWTVEPSDVREDVDFLYAIGAGGLGLSLILIHIYVTPIKRFLQALWAVGVIGSIGTYLTLARPLDERLVQYVIDNPTAVWFVGPLFAALTGLVFKEGLCYGKLEAGILTFIIPTVLLGHLSGLMDNGVKLGLLGVWMGLFVIFAARKFQQPIKDDIGDKSVFMFNALPEEEKKALLRKLEQQSYQE